MSTSDPETAPILVNAVTPLPKGKLATLVTYLALEPVEQMHAPSKPHSLAFERVSGRDHARYLAVFRKIGQPWLWSSRLLLAQERLIAILDDPDRLAFIIQHDGRDIGLCEVDCRNGVEAELAYLGLEPDACGQGFGLVMMQHAIACVMERGINRLILHTCQMDDPRAPSFYRSCGFVPYRLALEVMDDPRAIGLYPAGSAPHIPFIRERIKP